MLFPPQILRLKGRENGDRGKEEGYLEQTPLVSGHDWFIFQLRLFFSPPYYFPCLLHLVFLKICNNCYWNYEKRKVEENDKAYI